VTSGCHSLDEQRSYRMDPCHYHASGIDQLVPSLMVVGAGCAPPDVHLGLADNDGTARTINRLALVDPVAACG
jgi:hypothetical protein